MKTCKYIAAALLLSITTVKAQRMRPGQKGLEVHGGALSDKAFGSNYYLNLNMSVNGKNGHYGFYGLEYQQQQSYYRDRAIPLEAYLAEGGYSFRLLGDHRRTISLNAALSGAAGYETVNKGNRQLYDGSVIQNEDGFVYGAGGRLSLEIYLCDRLVFIVQGRARMLWNTSRQQLRPSAGLGLRFNF